ncbi:MAG: HD domain-containing protein [Burkholderiaceae bacterium]
MCAALLHDTIEDTDTTVEEASMREFGPEVAVIVAEVTDDKTLARAERKRRQVEHAATISDQAKRVKLADKICNLDGRGLLPACRLVADRRREYFDWAQQVINACVGSMRLWCSADGLFGFGHEHRTLPHSAQPGADDAPAWRRAGTGRTADRLDERRGGRTSSVP